ncbi:MAG TPA: WXG100 family type VII secretion target [Candidatus Dormibacteraeota bacterium]|jgi:WXG100 family type VII secretion target|nr:WXG100 family type VII secretion target [Candidatus Dormibacteraeota bacterium]
MINGAGGGRIRADLPVMQMAANHVYEVNQAIQGQLSMLLARVEPLQGAWRSPEAAPTFQALVQRYHEQKTALNTVLREIGDCLVRSHGNIAVTEQSNQEGSARITGQLA